MIFLHGFFIDFGAILEGLGQGLGGSGQLVGFPNKVPKGHNGSLRPNVPALLGPSPEIGMYSLEGRNSTSGLDCLLGCLG